MYSHIIRYYLYFVDTYVITIYISDYLLCNSLQNFVIDPGGIHLMNIEWQRNGQKIYNTSHYTIHNIVYNTLRFYRQLQINSNKTSLAGIFSCVAWIGNDKTRNMTANTTVTVQSEL